LIHSEKIFPVLLVVVLIGLLSAYSSSNVDNTEGNESEATFTGTIEEISGQMAVVKIEDQLIRRNLLSVCNYARLLVTTQIRSLGELYAEKRKL